MENLEQKILEIVQDGFPLEEHPYATLGRLLGVSEDAAFDSVEGLRKSGVIRRLGGVYDSRRLGYISRLCTGVVSESELESFAAAADKIPSITHNYVRSHAYNVWFTVIARSESEIQETVRGLEAETCLHDAHVLSASRMFKINTVMKSASRSSADASGQVAAARVTERPVAKSAEPFVPEAKDRRRINLLCQDIPHTKTPFSDLGIDVAEIRGDLDRKIMRRFGAVLRHQQAGFDANAMVCLAVADTERAGALLAEDSHVSHCYERSPFEGFPYNVYAMFHGQSEAELEQSIGSAVSALNGPDHAVLTSLKELKKTSFVYFA
ncbi:Lrp/AsnC family transcriptional regulator [Fibrobacter sp.]|uniref:Lrp/AsnC family transcriptional regulator n=1 Tax=Fibrobacter sp. TaxID=35828 RepID=UPI0038909B40